MVNPVRRFILDNFDMSDYERQELRCKGRIENKWGNLLLPDGTTINPAELYTVRIMHEGSDMYCREPIDEHTICVFYVVMHEGELYYIDVDSVVELEGDMWNYGDNQNNVTWNTYIVPVMNTCNHHLYPLRHNSAAAFVWYSNNKVKTLYLTIEEANERGYLENMM